MSGTRDGHCWWRCSRALLSVSLSELSNISKVFTFWFLICFCYVLKEENPGFLGSLVEVLGLRRAPCTGPWGRGALSTPGPPPCFCGLHGDHGKASHGGDARWAHLYLLARG